MSNPYAPTLFQPQAPRSQLEVAEFSQGDPKSRPARASTREWPRGPSEIAYHGLAGDIARAIEAISEVDPAGVLATVQAIVGALAGSGRVLQHGTAHGANEFVVLVGDTSTGRKGTTFSILRALFDAALPGWDEILVPGLGSGEGLIQHLKDNEPSEERALVLETEMGRLLRVMARDGSTLSPILRDAWDGVPLGRFLSRGGILVRRHHVGCLAHITPVELRERLTDVDAANGFGNRFLWVAVRRPRRVPFPEPTGPIVSPFVSRMRTAIEFAQTPGAVWFTAAAREEWRDFYCGLEPVVGLTGALLARAEVHVARLAVGYAILDCSEAIDVPHLRAARPLWEYAAASVRYIFGESTGSRDADDVLRILELEGPLSKSALRSESGIRNAARLQNAIDLLVEQRRARIWWGESAGKLGRPPLMVALT